MLFGCEQPFLWGKLCVTSQKTAAKETNCLLSSWMLRHPWEKRSLTNYHFNKKELISNLYVLVSRLLKASCFIGHRDETISSPSDDPFSKLRLWFVLFGRAVAPADHEPVERTGAPNDRFLSNAFRCCFRLSGVLLKLRRLILACTKKLLSVRIF